MQIEQIQAQVPAARAYFPKLVLSDVAVKMSEARVPAIFGRINNAGDRAVDEVRLMVDFYSGRGAQSRLIYQEGHNVVVTPIEFTGFIRPALPLVPGETRDFGFELIAPPQIQQQSEPSLTVGSMVFTQSKAPLPSLAIENPARPRSPQGRRHRLLKVQSHRRRPNRAPRRARIRQFGNSPDPRRSHLQSRGHARGDPGQPCGAAPARRTWRRNVS